MAIIAERISISKECFSFGRLNQIPSVIIANQSIYIISLE